MVRLLPFLLAFALAACASHEQTESEAAAAQAANAAEDAARCKSYGLQPDTPDYLKCLDKLADERERESTRQRVQTAKGLLGRPPM